MVRYYKDKYKQILYFNYDKFIITFDYVQNLSIPYFREEFSSNVLLFSNDIENFLYSGL